MGSTMKFRRFALALLAAAVLLGSLGVSNVSAWGPRRGYVGPGYYPYPVAGYGWGGPAYPLYNPYVAPYPAYGILPPPGGYVFSASVQTEKLNLALIRYFRMKGWTQTTDTQNSHQLARLCRRSA